jgi:hypothetical protein
MTAAVKHFSGATLCAHLPTWIERPSGRGTNAFSAFFARRVRQPLAATTLRVCAFACARENFGLRLDAMRHPLLPINDCANRFQVRLNLQNFTRISVATSSASDSHFIFELPDFALDGADKFVAQFYVKRMAQALEPASTKIFQRARRLFEPSRYKRARIVASRESKPFGFTRLDEIEPLSRRQGFAIGHFIHSGWTH